MSPDAASRMRQPAEFGWTKRNLGGSHRHREQPLPGLLLRELPTQTPAWRCSSRRDGHGVGSAHGYSGERAEPWAREALAAWRPGRAGLRCVWLRDAWPWEHHFGRGDFYDKK